MKFFTQLKRNENATSEMEIYTQRELFKLQSTKVYEIL